MKIFGCATEVDDLVFYVSFNIISVISRFGDSKSSVQ